MSAISRNIGGERLQCAKACKDAGTKFTKELIARECVRRHGGELEHYRSAFVWVTKDPRNLVAFYGRVYCHLIGDEADGWTWNKEWDHLLV